MTKSITSIHPAITVRARLFQANGKLLSVTEGPNGTALEFWQTPKQTYILHNSGLDGCELYAPTTDKNDLNATLKTII